VCLLILGVCLGLVGWLSFLGRTVDALAVVPMKDVATCDKPRGAGSER
jgi:hypothetical protein